MPAASDHATDDLFIAMAHPLRRRILRQMLYREAFVSPRELADALGKKLSGLSYHVTVLARCGAIELVETQPVRGSTQHFYRLASLARWALIALDDEAEQPDGRRL
jgi:DNA-binding transcriptional ArsR family regulator